jgi:hypothetical protein
VDITNGELTMSRKVTEIDISGAMRAAKEVLTVTETPKKGPGIITSTRFKEHDRRRIDSTFARYGVSLSRGLNLSALYVCDLVESGAIQISSAGIIDRRG